MNNKPSSLNTNPFLNIKITEINGIEFTNKDIIQACIYMSPSIVSEIVEDTRSNSIVISIDAENQHVSINFMRYPETKNKMFKGMKAHGLLNQEFMDEHLCPINSASYDYGMYSFLFSTGYMIDNFDIHCEHYDDSYIMMVPIDGEEEDEEVLIESVIIGFDDIKTCFNHDPVLE